MANQVPTEIVVALQEAEMLLAEAGRFVERVGFDNAIQIKVFLAIMANADAKLSAVREALLKDQRHNRGNVASFNRARK